MPIVIDTSHTGTEVKDESVTSSSGPASGIFVAGQTPARLSISLNSLIPDERIKVSLLLTSKPKELPIVSIKSDASTATLESSLAHNPSVGDKTLEISDVLIPILGTSLLSARRRATPGYFATKKRLSSAHTSALVLHSATWGARERIIDVTHVLRSKIRDDTLIVRATNDFFGTDPCPGLGKYLSVEYSSKGKQMSRIVPEPETLSIP